jgi:hypothetical protein
MVNRSHADNARNFDRSHDRGSSQHRRSSAKAIYVDDIITSLANAHENRRARQVTEWQRLGAQTFRASV